MAQTIDNLFATWSNAGTTYTGFRLNITDTASNASSLLMDLQVGGVSKFKVDKAGVGTFAQGVTVASAQGVNASTGSVRFGVGGIAYLYIDSIQIRVPSYGISFDSGGGITSPEFTLLRDAANTLAQRNSTNAQESRVYATYTSGTSYQRCGIKTGKVTLSNVSGASVTATSLIPAGAFLIGVTSRVNTALGTGNGTTGYTVGTASDPDLWGAITGTAAGTASGSANYTAPGASGLFTSATDVIVTATGGNFDATGVIELGIHYLLTEAD